MLDPSMLSFVRESLPPAPARVLEVGAGDGALARELMAAGYDVLAVDPASTNPEVRRLPLHELSEPSAGFDAAVAVLSMHHVEPLTDSCHRLAQLIRSGGALVLDEIDFERFDETAAAWWLDHRDPPNEHESSAQEIVAHLRDHCHLLSSVTGTLSEWFELTPPDRGPYLYRWELDPGLRETEVELIARGELPATGARLRGVRR